MSQSDQFEISSDSPATSTAQSSRQVPPWPQNSERLAGLSASIAELLGSIQIDKSFVAALADAVDTTTRTGSEAHVALSIPTTFGIELCVQVSVRKSLKTSESSKPKTAEVSPRSKWSW